MVCLSPLRLPIPPLGHAASISARRQRRLHEWARAPRRRSGRVTCARAPPGLRLRAARRADRSGAPRRALGEPPAGARWGHGRASATARCASCRSCLQPGDLLVFNDTRVVAARLLGTKPTGGRVEIFLERALGGHAGAGAARGEQADPRRAGNRHRRRRGAGPGTRGRAVAGGSCRAPALEFFDAVRRRAAAAVHPARAGGRRPRALPEHLCARAGRGRGADREPAFRCAADGGTRRARRDERASSRCTSGRALSAACAATTSKAQCCTPSAPASVRPTCEAIAAHARAGGRVVAVGTTVVRALESAAAAASGSGPEAALAPKNSRTAPALAPGRARRGCSSARVSASG